MEYLDKIEKQPDIKNAYKMIIDEHINLYKSLDFSSLLYIVEPLEEAKNIFLIGAGRTGFMVKAAAMRLMHLGYSVYVVGETITPAIEKDDILITVSGSGTTSSIVNAAKTAYKNKTKVIAFTTDNTSTLVDFANYTITIPAAGKQDHDSEVSKQYAGSLFEQAFLLLFDSLIQFLWESSTSSAEELWKRHTNIE
ncbi:6-phospho-3-hexuloisomerase [Zunongwangia sp.]|uniref:6-phospho-3-hexuloisomerase n=1 Tax=Zunongwangia sp. TaxID=1965325 RepID=UPI003AA96A9A